MKFFAVAFVISMTVSVCQRAPATPSSQVQIRLQVQAVQDAALDADLNAGQDRGTTRTIVTWCRDADVTLRDVPAGWRAMLATSWLSARRDIHTVNPRVVRELIAMDAMLGVIPPTLPTPKQ